MKNSFRYYEQIWEITPTSRYSDPDHTRVIALLLDYTKALGIANNMLFSGLHFSSAGRFFTGHWNRHHVDAVKATIDPFFSAYTFRDDECDAHYSEIKNILGLLKSKIGSSTINSFGDLATIFEVIKQKTGVDYYTLRPVSSQELEKELVVREQRATREMLGVLRGIGEALNDTMLSEHQDSSGTVVIPSGHINLEVLRSELNEYKPSSYFFGDSPEISKLKKLLSTKRKSGEISISFNEIEEAVKSATGLRARSDRYKALYEDSGNSPKSGCLRATDEIIHKLGQSFRNN